MTVTQSKHKFIYIPILIFSLFILLSPGLAMGQSTADVSVAIQSITDTTWVDEEGSVWNAVLPGNLYAYTIQVENLTEHTADSIRLTQMLPDLIGVVDTENDPLRTGNMLIWDLDSLAQGSQSWQVLVQAKQAESTTQIISSVLLTCSDDTLVHNNSDQDTLYVVNPVLPTPDLSVSQFLHSDSFWVNGSDSVAVLHQGDVYPISISLANWTSVAAHNVRLCYVAHDSLHIFSCSPSPEVFTSDSVVWYIDQIDPVRSLKYNVDVMVPQIMPAGENRMAGTVTASAENEDSTKWANNTSTLEMINYGRAAEPFEPQIEVIPAAATMNDSLNVRVQFPIHILQWDVWIYLPDGSIIKDFADRFISSTQPIPDEWYEIDESFFLSGLQGSESSMQLIFEVRATGDYGSYGSAQATATISRANEFALVPPNVVSPEMSEIPIDFNVPESHVELKLYDLSGRLIHELINEFYPAGRHTYMWNGITNRGQQIGSGVYLVTLKAADESTWKKMIVVR